MPRCALARFQRQAHNAGRLFPERRRQVSIEPWVTSVAQFILQLLQSVLVWPTAVIIVAWWFRRPLRSLFAAAADRMAKVQEATFGSLGLKFPPEQPAPNAAPAATPAGRIFACQHFTRDVVWRPEYQQHANRVLGLARIVAVADPAQVQQLAGRYASIFAVAPRPGTTGAAPCLDVDTGNAPLALGRFMADAIPKSQVRFYPGEGHLSLISKYIEEILYVLIA